jgi:carboxylesterase type B
LTVVQAGYTPTRRQPAARTRRTDVRPICWVNFVHTRNPNEENLPKWMSFDPNQSTTMALQLADVPATANSSKLNTSRIAPPPPNL